MSPNSYIAFNSKGLLCGYPGEQDREDPCFIWTYSTFEDYLNESITPSMYNFMAGYVQQNFTKDDLWELAGGDYSADDLESDAIDAYFNTPLNERITMHEQELVNMRASKRRAEDRESAAIDAMLEEHRPFDDSSPIANEYNEFMRGIIDGARAKIERLERQICEEDEWRGGHEEGAENDTHLDPYDHMDES